MPLTTPNYMMYLPDVREKGWGPKVNQNFTTTDAELQRLSSATVAINVALSSMLATVNGAASAGQIVTLQNEINDLSATLARKQDAGVALTIDSILGLREALNALNSRVGGIEQTGGSSQITMNVTTAQQPHVSGQTGEPVQFHLVASSTGGAIASVVWNFGDGVQYSNVGNDPIRTLPAGTANVSVTVTDAVNGHKTVTVPLTVSNGADPLTFAATTVTGYKGIGSATDNNVPYVPGTRYQVTGASTSDTGVPVAGSDTSFTFSGLNNPNGAATLSTVNFDITNGKMDVLSLFVNGTFQSSYNAADANGHHSVSIPPYNGTPITVRFTLSQNGYCEVNNASLTMIYH